MSATEDANGYEAMASAFVAARSCTGAGVVRRWARAVPEGATVVDVGCGSVDASPTLISMYRRRFPTSPCACETAEHSGLFGLTFDGAVAVGLLFLLAEENQRKVLLNISRRLHPAGRLLFTAPQQACTWKDALTDRPCLSLGLEAYRNILAKGGMHLVEGEVDEGGSDYVNAIKGGG